MTDTIDYEKHLLKEYGHWTVYLHYNQAYLGRNYIALNRQGNLDPYTDTTPQERAELELIITDLQSSISDLYQPELYNYANFRNTWPRCHWHVIPRYATPRTLNEQIFTDDNWGKNYAPYNRNFEITTELFEQIKSDMSQRLHIVARSRQNSDVATS